ncbi:hypothetical protein [Falsiroseomonas tokyonensis]|uniref:Transglycosylase SLT domain-containing protein n=1 Tax=Falsiroseomonas tokyonensis TaxID=430521 RepID=A0ABV7BTY1_9PROT|nr:hypothetical protein [Falsiroseomonas tokyonensis]
MAEVTWTAQAFLEQVIDPALEALALDDAAARDGLRLLLLGTALQESGLKHLRQLPNRDGSRGPALGYFQMEPATHDDIWATWLAYRGPLASRVLAVAGLLAGRPKAELLVQNHIYAAVMARLRYRRAPGRLPAAGDVAAMAAYWKAHYNTALGRGRASEFEAKLAAALPALRAAPQRAWPEAQAFSAG